MYWLPLINASNIELFRFFGDTVAQAEDDERRLFYVALTRAKERLVFLCESNRSEESPFLDPFKKMIVDIPVPQVLLVPEFPDPSVPPCDSTEIDKSSSDPGEAFLPEAEAAP